MTMLFRYIVSLTATLRFVAAATIDNPNLVIIMTDEHNIRTLGCYRDLLSKTLVWGLGVKVDTPNIDSLASDGAIFTNFNAVAPLCTPSRASFMTGLYPKFTGASENHGRLKKNAVTFAEVLKKNGYTTNFVGKWHLNGDAKPGFSNEVRKFGFTENKYQFNRGHWKYFDEDLSGKINAYEWEDSGKVKGGLQDAYSTDFLFSKGIDFIKNQTRKEKPFVLMLSIPDPHGPNDVRPPYDTMYNHMKFELPPTAVAAYHYKPAPPGWANFPHSGLKAANQTIMNIENSDKWQTNMRNYFGMVKLVDDKVGELLLILENKGLNENTIVVFTSDHGDMMGEHGKYNKGRPYQTSAGVPFIIRYPGIIKKKKIIRTAYSSPDFAPTILSVMGIDHSKFMFQGIDGTDELLSDSISSKRKQVRFITDSKRGVWAAAVDRQYKLVMSENGIPWLFDLKEDPSETINYSKDQTYDIVIRNLQIELVNALEIYKLPLADKRTVFYDVPVCSDPKDQIPARPKLLCKDLTKVKHSSKCSIEEVNKFCPDTCGTCCKDSPGFLRINGKLRMCNDFKKNPESKCKFYQVSKFCPVTCSICTPLPSSKPSISPSLSNLPTTSNTQELSNQPSSGSTKHPSLGSTKVPSSDSTKVPSSDSTKRPSTKQSIHPSISPSTLSPTESPSALPVGNTSVVPSMVPSDMLTIVPTIFPMETPTEIPSIFPSISPSTNRPTETPSTFPVDNPSVVPSMVPSEMLTIVPTIFPRDSPTEVPSNLSSDLPSDLPSDSHVPSTTSPTETPSAFPVDNPSVVPSIVPSDMLTIVPSTFPMETPTEIPSNLLSDSHVPSSTSPTETPSTFPVDNPRVVPSMVPSDMLIIAPTIFPGDTQTGVPSNLPSDSHVPSTTSPIEVPPTLPVDNPSVMLSIVPTIFPRDRSTEIPSDLPSNSLTTTTPTDIPSTSPFFQRKSSKIVSSTTKIRTSTPSILIIYYLSLQVLIPLLGHLLE